MPAINIWQSDLKYEKSIPSISCHQDFNISQLIGVCTAAAVISDMIPLIGKWLRFKPSSCTCQWVLLKQDSFLNSPQKPTHQKSVCGKIRLDVSWFIPIWHRFNPIALITKFLQIYFQFIKWKWRLVLALFVQFAKWTLCKFLQGDFSGLPQTFVCLQLQLDITLLLNQKVVESTQSTNGQIQTVWVVKLCLCLPLFSHINRPVQQRSNRKCIQFSHIYLPMPMKFCAVQYKVYVSF